MKGNDAEIGSQWRHCEGSGRPGGGRNGVSTPASAKPLPVRVGHCHCRRLVGTANSWNDLAGAAILDTLGSRSLGGIGWNRAFSRENLGGPVDHQVDEDLIALRRENVAFAASGFVDDQFAIGTVRVSVDLPSVKVLYHLLQIIRRQIDPGWHDTLPVHGRELGINFFKDMSHGGLEGHETHDRSRSR